jgi:Flp pilus assembly protein TadG
MKPTRRLSLAHDEAGVAAIEFALALPLLVALLFGAVEFVQLFSAARRVDHAAAAMADIVSQGPTITDAQLTDVMTVAPTLVAPLPTATVGEQISSFTADATGKVTQDWTTSNNYSGTAPAVPTGYLAASESVIVADVTYQFNSPLRFFIPGTITFQQHAYVRPRLSGQVAKS